MTDKWHRMVSSALVGTRNRPYLRHSEQSSLDDLLNRIENADEEQALLAAAAALVVYRDVGRVQVDDYARKLPEPAAPETLQPCSDAAADYLERALEETTYPTLLLDWMDGALSANVRIPENFLLPMLECLAELSERNIHAGTSSVIGERGRWLAAQRNKWQFINWENDFEKAWRKVKPRVQQVLFRLLRAKDPAYAREFIQKKFDDLDEFQQSKYIDWLAQGDVYPDDEPFLESLLDDDNRHVNEAAADALRKLPTSAFVQRMKDRVRNRVWTETADNSTLYLRWDAVNELDDAMLRDTVDRRGYVFEQRPEVASLRFMLGCVPPVNWCEWLNMTPEELIVPGSRTPTLFISAWARAVNIYGDETWAKALADHYLSFGDERRELPLIMNQLSQHMREEIIIQQWSSDSKQSFSTLATSGGRLWSVNFSEKLVEIYRTNLLTEKNAAAITKTLEDHALKFHPQVIPQVDALVNQYVETLEGRTEQGNRQRLENTLELMELREGIWRVFR